MTEPGIVKTTKLDFNFFRDQVRQWIGFLGLSGWNISFQHKYISETELAMCVYDLPAKNVTFYFSNKWPRAYYNREEIAQAARHETFEALLCRFGALAENRFTTQNEINEARHEIIAILENTMAKHILAKEE